MWKETACRWDRPQTVTHTHTHTYFYSYRDSNPDCLIPKLSLLFKHPALTFVIWFFTDVLHLHIWLCEHSHFLHAGIEPASHVHEAGVLSIRPLGGLMSLSAFFSIGPLLLSVWITSFAFCLCQRLSNFGPRSFLQSRLFILNLCFVWQQLSQRYSWGSSSLGNLILEPSVLPTSENREKDFSAVQTYLKLRF